MDDKPYSNRELDAKLTGVAQTSDDNRALLTEKIDEVSHSLKNKLQGVQNVLELTIRTNDKDYRDSLSRIEVQTSKTNGRVGALEGWKSFMSGGLAVLTFLVTALLAMVAILVKSGHL